MHSSRKQEIERGWKQQSRNIDRAISKFRVRHMNDTKWREVFEVIRTDAAEIACVRFKFVDRDVVIDSAGRMTPVSPSWCDGFPGPFQYRELEWMEVPRWYHVRVGNPETPQKRQTQEIARLRDALGQLGHLPIRGSECGFRIIGYE